jgi:hypothetical protein
MSKSKVYTSNQQKNSKKTKRLSDLDQSNLNLGFSNSGGSTLSSASTTSAVVVINGSSNFSPTPFPGLQMPIANGNGNGKIDNGKEMFGGGVGEGFAKLDSFDTNRDGIVNTKDQGFDSLKIWQDRNSNGVTDRGELQSLSVFGIKSLNVDHIAYDQAAELDKQGNILGERGSVTTLKGCLSSLQLPHTTPIGVIS